MLDMWFLYFKLMAEINKDSESPCIHSWKDQAHAASASPLTPGLLLLNHS